MSTEIKTFERTEAVNITHTDKLGNKGERAVCPDCVKHEQIHPQLIDGCEIDCKNTFTVNGKIVSQCCCYSKEHLEGS